MNASRFAIQNAFIFFERVFNKNLLYVFLFKILVITSVTSPSFSQGVIPTKGKDFWIGFPYNPQFSNSLGTKRCDVFITADVSTSGLISIPQQGWTQVFTVTANQTTTISLPIIQVENTTSEVVENKGVQILTLDTVSVFAISFQQYTADGTVVYPRQSLGIEYRVSSYTGISNSNPPLCSDLLILATEDGTQVTITPTATTLGGHSAGIPFTVGLDAGQTYQVIAAQYTTDLTGTVVKGTDTSGTCRPFAVFSGTVCTRVPSGCSACDILYDQAIPVNTWGKTYYAVPFSFATQYTLRILADQNNTSYSVDGGPPTTINAGQFTEINNIVGTRCITGNKPMSVIQYMQGQSCAAAGDPSMMYLNAHEQKIDRITFSTVTSTIINQHNVNVIMNTAHIGQLTLDGSPVPAASFTPMTACSNISYAQLSLTQGSHTLAADSGFTAYVYGTGGYESYAYSVGSFSKSQPIQVDSILCTSDTIHLGTSSLLYGIWWSTNTLPNDTIGTGPVLVLTPPIMPDIYIEHGNEFISGCEKNFYFSVEVPDTPQTWITSSATIACQNQQVQLNAGTIPASGVYQYTWTPATGLNNPNIANPVVTVTSSGWYHVTISSPNGCAPTVYDSIYLNVLAIPLPNINGGANQSICSGTAAVLSASGGIAYLWNPGGDTTASITVSPVATTNYIVFATDSNGCGNSDTITVTVMPLPNPNAGADQSLCSGDTVTLTASGGTSYLWNPGGNTSSSIAVSPSSNTNYIVEVTGANGCINTDTVLITVNPLPSANAGTDLVICSGDTATLTASGGISYLWTPGGGTSGTISVSPLSSTNYIVLVTDVNGCGNSDTVNVGVNPLPVANAGADQTICSGASVILTATGGTSFVWNPGGSTGNSITVSPVSTTNYIVTVTDSNACQKNDTVLVVVNPLPAANAGPDLAICIGGTAVLTAAPAGAAYLWTPGGSTSASVTVSPLLTTSYMVEVTDGNGCIKSDSVMVTVNPLPVANAGPDQTSCSGFQTTLTAAGGVSYLWTPGGNTTASITVSPPATTNYIVQVTDINGCSAYDTVLVTVDPYISGSSSFQPVCIGSSVTLSASGGVAYWWTPGGSTNSSISISPQASIDYIVHITTPVGCFIYDTIHVIVNPLPSANAGTDQAICSGKNATLTASGGTSYLWSTGSTNSTLVVSPVSSQDYIVLVTDNNGCQQSDTVRITVNSLPLANAGPDLDICPGDSATLVASGGAYYLWSPGGSSNASVTVSPLTPAVYTVLVTDLNGCTGSDTVSVGLYPDPVPSFTHAVPVCENSAISFFNTSFILSGSIVNNTWNFGDGTTSSSVNPVHSYAAPGDQFITLYIISDKGCSDSAGYMLTVNALPVVDFTMQNECVLEEVKFSDLSIISSGSIVHWDWQFGDSSVETMQHPSHAYMQAGMYDVTLTTTSDSGCSSSYTQVQAIEIYPQPEAQFYAVPPLTTIFEPVIHFVDQSSGGILWKWDFGDDKGTSGLQSPYYSYNDTGLFHINMILTSYYGCLDTAYGEVYIVPGFTVYFPNAFTPDGDDQNDLYNAHGIGISDFNMHIFDRWGNEIFYSDNVSTPWNGKSSNNVNCNEGVYVYTAKVVDFKKITHEFKGTIALIR